MLNAVTIMTDAMSGQTAENAAKILTRCINGVKKCVHYSAENPFCYQYKNDAE